MTNAIELHAKRTQLLAQIDALQARLYPTASQPVPANFKDLFEDLVCLIDEFDEVSAQLARM